MDNRFVNILDRGGFSMDKEMTQKELCLKMLYAGRSTVDFLNTRLCAEYRKWISIVRQELEGTGEYVDKIKISDKPRNYYYKIKPVEPTQGELL